MRPALLPHLSDGSLIVRLANPADVPAILDFFLSNRAAFAAVEPRRHDSYYSLEACQMRVSLNQVQYQEGRNAGLFIFEPDNTSLIGTINFTGLSGYPHHGATLGYSLALDQWGQGRMQKALQLALGWMFSEFNLHRICANHLPDNERSSRLLAKLGFKREGYAADYLLIDGVWRDHVLTALTHQNWRALDDTAALVRLGHGRPAP